jgi:truncated hemoglobin YjbI
MAMRQAVDAAKLSEADDALVWDYFERAALAMVNTFEN